MIFTNNISPWFIHFQISGHDFGVRWYGMAYATGFFLAFFAFRWAIKRGELVGSPKLLDNLLTAVIVGVLVGGRLGFVIQNLGEIPKDPLFPLKIYEGGMAFFGGLVGVILGMAWVGKREGIKFFQLADVATIPAMLGLGIGRLANFANAELWGRPTHANWGVIYPRVDQQPRHPSELYEAGSHFLAFLILLLLRRMRPDWCLARPGRLSALYLILYGTFRFLTDFLREEPLVGPLNSGQYASGLVALFGLILWFLLPKGALHREDEPHQAKTQAEGARPPSE